MYKRQGVVAKNGEKNVDVRFELPLLTGNTKQNASTSTTADEGFDLNAIVELQATQENNPGDVYKRQLYPLLHT